MIPLKEIEKVVKAAGVERVSEDGLKELQKELERVGSEVAKDAAVLAKAAKRDAISAQDVLKASGKA
ncbi:MAG: NFYB/HAP3 family transcription factor subunit [Candidatus Aenigmatarchaeota archaeon]